MAKYIEFLEDDKINSADYKKGSTAKVSDSIAKAKKASGKAKEITEKEFKKKEA